MNVSNTSEIIGNYYTQDTNNTNIQPVPVPVPVWGQYGGITSLIALVILMEQMFTLYGMVKVKRLPFATKFLSCVNVTLDCVFVSILVVAPPYNSIFGQNDTVTNTGKRIGTLAIAGSWLCLAMLSVERFLCLSYPNEYMRLVSKRRVVLASLVPLGVLWAAKLCARYITIPAVYRQMGYPVDVTHHMNILTWILGICITICLLCNGQVLRIVNQHKRQMVAQASTVGGDAKEVKPLRGYKSTNMSWILNGLFLGLYLPLFFVKVIKSNNINAATMNSVEFLLMLITCVVNPLVYAWRLREFRYHLLALFGRCNKRIADLAERERTVVYDITTKDTNTTRRSDFDESGL